MFRNIISVPAANLTKSPVNVRTRSDPDADAELEASILAHGLIQNLVGVPVARQKGHYRITAGGRRLDAIQRLIEKGSLPPDHEVPVLVLKNAKDGREISLAENYDRLPMNPAEECRAFRDIVEVEAKKAADVAKRFGLTERFVLGRLRLANLAEPIFDALENGDITLDVARAYCTTADTNRQNAIWAMLSESYYGHNVDEIRRRIRDYSYKGDDPRVLLVGRETYEAAGGRIEDADLYSTAGDERWIDTYIVDELAMAKMTAEAEALREREGFGEVRPIANTRIPYMEIYDLEPLPVERPPLSEDQESRKAEIDNELAELEAAYEEEGFEPTEEEKRHYTDLQAEYAAIVPPEPVIEAEQKAEALAYLLIGPDGQPHIHHELFAMPSAVEDAEDEENDGQDSREGDTLIETEIEEIVRNDQPIMSQRLRDQLAMMKTQLLALHVAADPSFALDLGTFLMAEQACRYGSSDVPSELRASAPSPLLPDFRPETPAATEWMKLDEALDRSWMNYQTLADRYDAFCALPDEARAAWLSWSVARTLHATPDARSGVDFLNHLGARLEIDVAAWWRPTAVTYFDKLTKTAILDLFQEIGGMELRSRYSGSRKHDLSTAAERLFGGDVIIEPEIRDRALAWVPDAMRFATPEVARIAGDNTEENHSPSVDDNRNEAFSQAA